MNPVFAVDFMNSPHGDTKPPKKAVFKSPVFLGLLGVGILLDIFGVYFGGNLLIFFALLMVLNTYVLDDLIQKFQNNALPSIMGHYENLLRWALVGWRPVHLLLGTVALFFISVFIFAVRKVPVVFFPQSDPNQVYVYLKLPVGSSVDYTDSITRSLEAKVNHVLGNENGKTNPIVESVISNVAIGASDPMSGDRSTRPELGRIQVSFVEFEKRHGHSSAPYLDSIRAAMKGIPGAAISVAQQASGPPTESPINIEVSSENFDHLTKTAVDLKNYLDNLQIPGVEELKLDVDLTNPEISLSIDRERAMIEGVSTAQIGMALRTALFGRRYQK